MQINIDEKITEKLHTKTFFLHGPLNFLTGQAVRSSEGSKVRVPFHGDGAGRDQAIEGRARHRSK